MASIAAAPGEHDTVRALLTTKTNIASVLKDPTGQPMVVHAETQRVLKQLDLADLTKYLQTGQSEQFAKEPLIGKWQAETMGMRISAFEFTSDSMRTGGAIT